MPYLTDYIGFIQSELDQSDLVKCTVRPNICINCEHNLVCPEFTKNHDFQKGTTLLPNKKDNYLVRIENFKGFVDSDIYVEYSQPNIFNIKNSIYNKYLNKIIYIPPLLCEYAPRNDKKNIDILTSFYNVFGRRQVLFNSLNNCFSSYTNIQNIFNQNLYDMYKQGKILVNIHQTKYHHTFEEIRVIPALLNGLVVIAEDSPLKETIPYHEYIIWCPYELILDTTKKTLNNYEFYFNKIHGEQSKLKEIFQQMKYDIKKDINECIKTQILS